MTIQTNKTYTIRVDECEHEGDIDRALDALKGKASVLKTRCPGQNGPEVGWALVSTSLSVKDLNTRLEEVCGCVAATGDQMNYLADMEEAEGEEDEEDED